MKLPLDFGKRNPLEPGFCCSVYHIDLGPYPVPRIVHESFGLLVCRVTNSCVWDLVSLGFKGVSLVWRWQTLERLGLVESRQTRSQGSRPLTIIVVDEGSQTILLMCLHHSKCFYDQDRESLLMLGKEVGTFLYRLYSSLTSVLLLFPTSLQS